MNKQINELLYLSKISYDDKASLYQVITTLSKTVLYEFKVATGEDDPEEIANVLIAEDWFEIKNDDMKECSLNYSYDEKGKYYIIEDNGNTSETRSWVEALYAYEQLVNN
ncbi:hypothetical protein ABER99_20240 [Paenibacillus glucanolyticus]|jgi:NH3-dependent NAD+ synthetase|uniref:Uncharacterized protein n=1 Tax=Paenibacillus glucanolyticus TaxID=59843 RepID=A0A163GKE6_9BACL|nr:hypothetical protein [Paenibacillus glucanolyticus]KZS45020.1 hypothetical protein AWU65_03295 [Paenibacillus glucanolyticus]OMF66743.1 hypothetical protein BK142_29420 [Paenibacillus glucanolyticus]